MAEAKKETKPPAFWKSFLSGGFAGVGIILTGHPMDTVKVRLQTQVVEAGKPPQYTGVVDCVQKTVRNEGFFGLYKGMATPLIGYTPMWALCFWGYDTGKRLQSNGQEKLNIGQIALAGAFSGVATTLVMAPAERIKSLLQVQSSSTTKLYNGPWDCFRKIGIAGTFQGTLATLYRDVPASAAYFGANELTKRTFARPDGSVSTPVALLAGAMAGVMNWTVCMPMDVVKSRVQTSTQKLNFFVVLKDTVAKEGFLALYKGFGAVMIRAIPCNAIGFVLYDICFAFLNEKFPE